ncbi:hypothetical protein [Azospirillum sp. TSO35-2]|uniref:hypothetical protein n=1 Tax=Azospirillum sp. TSO35-2 TaxID=716796 RepID=UPI0018EEA62B|nr:hypothetical protein [Azospirillum sp. TSO35-2]
MNASLTNRCTSLIDRARAAWLRRPLAQKLAARRTDRRPRMRMELLDLELFRIDIGGR